MSIRRGEIHPDLAGEFPALAIHWIEVEAGSGRSPQPVRERLRDHAVDHGRGCY